MKKVTLVFSLMLTLLVFLCSCGKDTNEIPVTPGAPIKEIINANLVWEYNIAKEILSAKLTNLQDPPGPNTADKIKAVYQFMSNNYQELPRGNSGNPDKVYYEIEDKSIVLHKYHHIDPHVNATVAAAIIVGLANNPYTSSPVPKKAKVVFR